MEYHRIYPKNNTSPIRDSEVAFLAGQVFNPFAGDDCGAKVIGLFYGRDWNEDEKTINEYVDQADAMILTSHVYGSSLSLWFIGFGSEEAEMLAKLTLVN
jgi:hypothetical protein